MINVVWLPAFGLLLNRSNPKPHGWKLERRNSFVFIVELAMQKDKQLVLRVDTPTFEWLKKHYEDTGVLPSEFARRQIRAGIDAEKSKAETKP